MAPCQTKVTDFGKEKKKEKIRAPSNSIFAMGKKRYKENIRVPYSLFAVGKKEYVRGPYQTLTMTWQKVKTLIIVYYLTFAIGAIILACLVN